VNKYLFVKILSAFILTVMSLHVFALRSDVEINQYVIKQWTARNGLPQSTATSVLQTDDGYMWIGTGDGLVKYNGKTFSIVNYLKGKKRDKYYEVNKILLSKEPGNLWISTFGGGVVKYNFRNKTSTLFNSDNGLTSNHVQNIAIDEKGTIFAGLENGDICKISGKVLKCDSVFGASKHVGVKNLRFIDGELWIISSEGKLYKTVNGKIEEIFNESSEFEYIYQDKNENIWLGTRKKGILLFNPENSVFQNAIKGKEIEKSWVKSIFEDSDNNLWVGTYGKGLFRIKKLDRVYNVSKPLPLKILNDIFEDREKNIWISSYYDGLSLLSESKFVTYTAKNGISHKNIFPVFLHKDNMYIGTVGGGLNVLGKDNRFRQETFDGKIPGNSIVYSLFSDKSDNLWVAIFRDGLYRITEDGVDIHKKAELAQYGSVISMLHDSKDVLWLGTMKGIVRKRGEKIDLFTKKEGLLNETVTAIVEDKNNRIWASTYKGLVIFDGEDVKNITDSNGLIDNIIYSLFIDTKSRIWVITRNGVSIFKDIENPKNLSKKNGLIFNVIYDVIQDDNENYWLTTNNGILFLKSSELERFFAGDISVVSPKVFNMSDGLLADEFNGGSNFTAQKKGDGSLWFSSILGVVKVEPFNMRYNKVVPPVAIDRIKVGGKEIELTGSETIELPPGSDRIEFHYASLSFKAPEKIEYKYMLHNMDTNWIEADNRNVAYYTNLDPGEYKFQIIASNNDNLWNSKGASISIYLKPYFYQTLWFKLIVAIFSAVIFVLILKLRTRRIRHRAMKLEQIVEERTGDLVKANIELEIKTKELEETSVALKEAALNDPMTELRNRRYFMEIVKPEIDIFLERRGFELKGKRSLDGELKKGYGILIFDIDHFKQVNDELGHDVGDRVLKQFSEILKTSIRKDDYAIRWGGEEFIIILKDTSFEFINPFAEKIKKRVEETKFYISESSEEFINKTCSIGFVKLPFTDERPAIINVEQSIMLADLGLYYSKEHGRNKAVNIMASDNIPSQEELAELLSSLEYGLAKKFLEIKIL